MEHYSEVGYDHLVPAYAKYDWSWVQYHNVDVHAVILLTLVVTGLVVVKLCQCVAGAAAVRLRQKNQR